MSLLQWDESQSHFVSTAQKVPQIMWNITGHLFGLCCRIHFAMQMRLSSSAAVKIASVTTPLEGFLVGLVIKTVQERWAPVFLSPFYQSSPRSAPQIVDTKSFLQFPSHHFSQYIFRAPPSLFVCNTSSLSINLINCLLKHFCLNNKQQAQLI